MCVCLIFFVAWVTQAGYDAIDDLLACHHHHHRHYRHHHHHDKSACAYRCIIIISLLTRARDAQCAHGTWFGCDCAYAMCVCHTIDCKSRKERKKNGNFSWENRLWLYLWSRAPHSCRLFCLYNFVRWLVRRISFYLNTTSARRLHSFVILSSGRLLWRLIARTHSCSMLVYISISSN